MQQRDLRPALPPGSPSPRPPARAGLVTTDVQHSRGDSAGCHPAQSPSRAPPPTAPASVAPGTAPPRRRLHRSRRMCRAARTAPAPRCRRACACRPLRLLLRRRRRRRRRLWSAAYTAADAHAPGVGMEPSVT
eukprot:352193-Chlamydomonas_euryale.AAC.19